MTTRKPPGRIALARRAQERIVGDVRQQLAKLRVKDGYIVVSNIGPYDHNPHDYPLPDAQYPRVFKALYEAVEYAQQMHRQGLDKLKISRVDGSVMTKAGASATAKTGTLTSTIVWKGWIPGTYGGWGNDNPRSPRVRAERKSYGSRVHQAREIVEMTTMLRSAGYTNPALSARKLAREGIGPSELAARIRVGKSGVGSLGHSHGFRDPARSRVRRAPKKSAKRARAAYKVSGRRRLAKEARHVVKRASRRGQEPAYSPATTAASRRRGYTYGRDTVKLTTRQKAALRSLVKGFGPLAYGEREAARKYHAMGLLKTNNIADPSYVDLTPAGKRALQS